MKRFSYLLLCFTLLFGACATAPAIETQAAARLDAPVIRPAKITKATRITIRWKKVKKADGYHLYLRKEGAKKYKKIKTTGKKDTSYLYTKASKNTTYEICIKAYKKVKGKTLLSPASKVVKATTTQPLIALTFDDGPGRYTNRLLNTLKKNDAKATFFLQGCNISMYPEVVKKMNKIGCECSNHSYDHPVLGNASKKTIQTQINKTDKWIKNLTGEKATLLRPPYGSISNTLRKNAKKPLILWSVDTLDWKYRNASYVENYVLSHAKDGSIILMHDIHKSTVDAMERVIPKLIKRGYKLVTVSELAALRNVELKNGAKYFSFP